MPVKTEDKVYMTNENGDKYEPGWKQGAFTRAMKKPIVVEALRINEPFEVVRGDVTMLGNTGDYLLFGSNGEKYPCDSDIFENNYTVLGTDNDEPCTMEFVNIKFQDGPIKEHGVNGCQVDDVLEVALNRLKELNSGDFRCKENSCAIAHIEEAMMWLEKRTRDRIQRGVEGYDIK